VQDSGEGRWTVEAAIEEAVPADVLTTALYARFRSRQEHTFGEKMLSAMRFGFGGHIEGKEPIDPEPTREMPHRRAPRPGFFCLSSSMATTVIHLASENALTSLASIALKDIERWQVRMPPAWPIARRQISRAGP
jgi:hypothetical protein